MTTITRDGKHEFPSGEITWKLEGADEHGAGELGRIVDELAVYASVMIPETVRLQISVPRGYIQIQMSDIYKSSCTLRCKGDDLSITLIVKGASHIGYPMKIAFTEQIMTALRNRCLILEGVEVHGAFERVGV